MALSRGSKWFLGFLALMLAGVAGGLYWVAGVLEDDVVPGRPVELTIVQGASLRSVSDDLRELGVVDSATDFRRQADEAGLAQSLQPGTYELETGMSDAEAIALLSAGPTVGTSLRFTITEGLPVELTLERLDEQFDHLSVADFRAALDARTDAGRNAPGLLRLPDWVPEPGEPADAEAAADDAEEGQGEAAGDPEGSDEQEPPEINAPFVAPERRPGAFEPYEGLLFPETYEVAPDATAVDVLQRMVDQLERSLELVDEAQILRTWEEQGLRVYDGLIVASLIERETRIADERPLVSGVIANRLSDGMRLQIDATVLYARGEHTDRVLLEDTEIDSPYNTYQVEGLPPTPIAGFGVASLQAAFDPAEHEYRFYVLAPGCQGPHVFAETLEEHNVNVEAFRAAGGCG